MAKILPARTEFGKFLRLTRKRAGYKKIVDLARKMKISATAIAGWEEGKNTPSKKYAEKLIETLGIKLEIYNSYFPNENLELLEIEPHTMIIDGYLDLVRRTYLNSGETKRAEIRKSLEGLLEKDNLDLIATGEVLEQGPMSQNNNKVH